MPFLCVVWFRKPEFGSPIGFRGGAGPVCTLCRKEPSPRRISNSIAAIPFACGKWSRNGLVFNILTLHPELLSLPSKVDGSVCLHGPTTRERLLALSCWQWQSLKRKIRGWARAKRKHKKNWVSGWTCPSTIADRSNGNWTAPTPAVQYTPAARNCTYENLMYFSPEYCSISASECEINKPRNASCRNLAVGQECRQQHIIVQYQKFRFKRTRPPRRMGRDTKFSLNSLST